MTTREKTWLCWSSGKDSAWSLHEMRQKGEVEVVALLSTLNRAADRVAMHAVREQLVKAQAEAAGLPLVEVWIPSPCSNQQYEAAMAEAMSRARNEGITRMAFGDLFLQDVRRYREEKLAGTGIEPIFPLWEQDTEALSRKMVQAGLEARITCVDPRKLDPSFAGRAYDAALLADLPEGVDPCGENGEFHTFVHAGPMFRRPISIRPGEIVERDGFVFADVLPKP
jgi:uncharacterized protein (TIGR00290 family)